MRITKVPRTTWSITQAGLISARKTIFISMRTFRIVSGVWTGFDYLGETFSLLCELAKPWLLVRYYRFGGVPRIVTIYTVIIGTKRQTLHILHIGHGRDVVR